MHLPHLTCSLSQCGTPTSTSLPPEMMVQWTSAHGLFQTCVRLSVATCPRVDLLDHRIWGLLGSIVHLCMGTAASWTECEIPIPCHTWPSSTFLNFCQFPRWKWYLVALICISLITSKSEHLLCFTAFDFSSCDCLRMVLPTFLLRLLPFAPVDLQELLAYSRTANAHG
jgi:hypothetical protein